ncbi:MAG: methyltransferase [Phaeospirillum sp.]|nr:methyltransferase [Phaeospirillum sp.]
MSGRKRRIVAAFSAAAATYNDHAEAQIRAAGLLLERLPPLPMAARVLELGCGTGLLTQRLLELLGPDAELLATDLSPAMIAQARSAMADSRLCFAVVDAEAPALPDSAFDLIVSSLAAQWFANLPATLDRLVGLLKPGGRLLLTTLGADTFAEWRAAHAATGRTAGIAAYPKAAELQAMIVGATVESAPFAIAYADARAFLKGLEAIGAATPRPGHRPLPAGALRRIMAGLGAPCSITWDILILGVTKESQ